jgi:DNA polymerase (family 10)
VRTPEELRAAAAAGRLRDVPGIGPKIEARPGRRAGARARAAAARALLLPSAWELAEPIAVALGGEVAGDPRRYRDACERLAVVCAAADPAPLLDRFAGLPQIVAVVEDAERRALGVTVEGVPVELLVAEPERFGTALVRATGSPSTWRRSSRCPTRRTRTRCTARSASRGARRAARGAVPRRSARARRGRRHPRRPALPHDVVRRPRERRGDGPRRPRAGYDYIAICDHTPGGRRGAGAHRRRRAPPGRGDRRGQRGPRAVRVLRGTECDILPDGRLDLPDDVLAELDWVQASVHGGQRMPRAEMTRRVEEALRNPYVRCLSHPTGRLIGRRPESALDLEHIYAVALECGVALEVNGLAPRLDLSGEHVRDALRAGVKIVCSTDAHSVQGLGNIELSVRTARRGWATAEDVLNTAPLEGRRR